MECHVPSSPSSSESAKNTSEEVEAKESFQLDEELKDFTEEGREEGKENEGREEVKEKEVLGSSEGHCNRSGQKDKKPTDEGRNRKQKERALNKLVTYYWSKPRNDEADS